jgi:hypothetical protein
VDAADTANDVAHRIDDVMYSLGQTQRAIDRERAAGREDRAANLSRVHEVKQLEMVELARRLCALTAALARPADPPHLDGLAPSWAGPGPSESVARTLDAAHRIMLRMRETGTADTARPVFLPAVTRICFATAMGALLDVPIGAVLVQESIAGEIVRTADAAGIGPAVAELVGPRRCPTGDRDEDR